MRGSVGTETILGDGRMPTAEEIELIKRGRGRNRKQLAEWGVSWPPKSGWRESLLSKYKRSIAAKITLQDLMPWDD